MKLDVLSTNWQIEKPIGNILIWTNNLHGSALKYKVTVPGESPSESDNEHISKPSALVAAEDLVLKQIKRERRGLAEPPKISQTTLNRRQINVLLKRIRSRV